MKRQNVQLSNLLFFILDEADKWAFRPLSSDRLVEDALNNELLQIYSRIPARGNANNEYRLQVGLSFFSSDIRRVSSLRRSTPTRSAVWPPKSAATRCGWT